MSKVPGTQQSPKPFGGPTSNVVFVGNARCFHTMDWYRSAQALFTPSRVIFATDLVASEGHVRIVRDTDCIVNLFNIDWLLFPRQSRFGNVWRNVIKIATVPLQVWRIRQIARSLAHLPNLVFHAHAMYYIWVCWLAGVDFVGTPQGSEVLVRPYRSRGYRYFAGKALSAAQAITVDSNNMRDGIRQLCGKEAIVVQNGIDVTAIRNGAEAQERRKVVSIRNIYPNYRIREIIGARTRSSRDIPLTFVYPSWEDGYRNACLAELQDGDKDMGRLPRQQLYELLSSALLVVSIPESDSSPRSVYEAIFCGCCVAVTHNLWIEALPNCMKARLHVVNLNEDDWFSKAVARAKIVARTPYVPSEAALETFDQQRSLMRVAQHCYRIQILSPRNSETPQVAKGTHPLHL